MLKEGDLVSIHYCARQGEVGIVTRADKPSVEFSMDHTRLYWVMTPDGDVDCYTGGQLVKEVSK